MSESDAEGAGPPEERRDRGDTDSPPSPDAGSAANASETPDAADAPPVDGTAPSTAPSPARVLGFPALSLVVLIGASGSGKSTFARKHFKPTEVLSSDFCRGLVCDDETSLAASKDAFDALRFIAAKRLARGLLTVVDATNVQAEARAPFVALAREYHCLPVAIVLNLPERVCHARNADRPGRDFGPHVVRNHVRQLRQSLRRLQKEGFRTVHVLDSVEEVDTVTLRRDRLWNDRRDDPGPFDVIGDVHGCFDELEALLTKLGYAISRGTADDGGARFDVVPPAGRKAVFLGDLVDRGPKTPEVLRLVMDMCASGSALAVPGNHDSKLVRALRGRDVKVTHGLAESLEQIGREPAGFTARATAFLDALVSHYVLDGGRLVVAHAGMKQEFQGRGSGRVREFALYGESTGETDEYGLPVRYPWAQDYRGDAHVVYGHTPVGDAEWLNRTICIDTGCVFGGRLTALRWPEKDLVSVPAPRVYYEPSKPFPPVAPAEPALSAQHAADDVLDYEDVAGKRVVETRLRGRITLRAEQTLPALEVMSRFAANPRWLVYLPPTMSPPETSSRAGLLEHPDEAFGYYRRNGIARVVCEEKHMGSRAVVIVCRDADAARQRFGVTTGEAGVILTRTGRRFFSEDGMETALLDRVRSAADAAGLWSRFETDWFVLDAELMPWSAKAQELIRTQYAAVGAAARAGLAEAQTVLAAAAARGADVAALAERTAVRAANADRYVDAYGRYCWAVAAVEDLRLAPFQLLATEGQVHAERDHLWHLEVLASLTAAGGVLQATRHVVVDLGDDASVAAGVAWWEEMTGRGGEGMVVKPIGGADAIVTAGAHAREAGERSATGGGTTSTEASSGDASSGETAPSVVTSGDTSSADTASQHASAAHGADLRVAGDAGPARTDGVSAPDDDPTPPPSAADVSAERAVSPREPGASRLQPAIKCRGSEYLRIIYGPDYDVPAHLERLRHRGLGTKRALALREYALGIEALDRFVRREPLRRVHECVFGVLAMETEPVDPRL